MKKIESCINNINKAFRKSKKISINRKKIYKKIDSIGKELLANFSESLSEEEIAKIKQNLLEAKHVLNDGDA